MTVDYRFGRAEDIDVVASFIQEAGGGLFEFLLEGVMPGASVHELLKFATTDSESVLHYGNALLAVENDVPLGMILGYPADEYGIPPVVESIVPATRLAHVRDVLTSRVAGTWYINSFAVSACTRGKGMGRSLLDLTADFAGTRGFSALSLHVWADNEKAVRFYHQAGFETVSRIEVPPARHLQHSEGMLLVRAVLPLQA